MGFEWARGTALGGGLVMADGCLVCFSSFFLSFNLKYRSSFSCSGSYAGVLDLARR